MPPEPALPDAFALTLARVHEAEGRGRYSFALFHARRHIGPLVWILPAHLPHRPMPRGLPPGVSERLLLLTPKTETDLLWSLEEALRSPPVALVIAEPSGPLSLTAGRRLQLAAEAGRTTGLILIRQGMGSNAAETRWHCDMLAGWNADSTPHRWSLIKNKKGTLGSWNLEWNAATSACHLVPKARQRYEPAAPPR